MPRPFVLSIALLGLGASQMGASPLGPEETPSDPSTWRWTVASILAQQRADDQAPEPLGATDFHQRYERYAPNGLPDPTLASNR